jgi:hypothetical protein
MRAEGHLLLILLFSYRARIPLASWSCRTAVNRTRYSIIFKLIEKNLIENEHD